MTCPNPCRFESLESRRLLTYTLTNLHLDASGGAGLENGLANSPEINNAGTIAAVGPTGASHPHATLRVVRSGTVKTIDVGNINTNFNSVAKGLNESNQVVGAYTDAKQIQHAFLSTLGKKDAVTIISLGGVKGVSGTIALGLNKSAVVVGQAGALTGKELAVVWARNPKGAYVATALSRLSKTSTSAIAFDINDKGVIVGTAVDAKQRQRAVIWTKSSNAYAITDLGAFKTGSQTAYGFAINELGQVVGSSTGADFRPHAVLYSPDGNGKFTMTDLGIPKGADASEATDLNESGVIVGRATFGSVAHTIIWTKGSDGKYTATDLQKQLPAKSGWKLEQPTSINDTGTIVGRGLFRSNDTTWMLTPSGKGSAIKLATTTSSAASDPISARPTPAESSQIRFSSRLISDLDLL